MIFEMEKCGGCRTCEIACSFHHTDEFNPSVSSIKILDKEGGAGYHVLLLEKDDGKSFACDGCQSLKEPLCMDYCKEKEQLEEMIKALLAKRKAGRESDMTASAP